MPWPNESTTVVSALMQGFYFHEFEIYLQQTNGINKFHFISINEREVDFWIEDDFL